MDQGTPINTQIESESNPEKLDTLKSVKASLEAINNFLISQIQKLWQEAAPRWNREETDDPVPGMPGNTLLQVAVKLAHPDPTKRISFDDALKLPYFNDEVAENQWPRAKKELAQLLAV